MTCYTLVNLLFGRKTRYKPLWQQGLRADHRIPKLAFVPRVNTIRRALNPEVSLPSRNAQYVGVLDYGAPRCGLGDLSVTGG